MSVGKLALPTALFDDVASLSANQSPAKQIAHINHAQQNDITYAQQFLYSYRHSPATLNTYRREIERFLQWCLLVSQKKFADVKRADIEDYISFCQNPPLTWIGVKQVPRFIALNGERVPNPHWRPFVVSVTKIEHQQGLKPDPKRYQLSPKALQSLFAVLSSFFHFLIQENYLEANPIAQIRQKNHYIRKNQQQTPIRRLSELQWGYVMETAMIQAKLSPETEERTLFIMQILYSLYLRISELASSVRWEPQMGHFHTDRDGHWWFTTVGKGNKERSISVSDTMLEALKRYRRSLGLTALPSTGEKTPLLMNARDGSAITSTRYIREIVQTCFDKSVARLRADGHEDEADQLMAATVHWLRHTGISDDVQHRPREHVRDDAGHSSSAITDRYIDVEMRARHASAKRKTMIPALFEV